MSFKFKHSPHIYIDFLDTSVEEALLEATRGWIESWINDPQYNSIGGKTNAQRFREHWKQFHDYDKSPDMYDLQINLVPLNRVGATEGASGAKVFVTYFDIIKSDIPLKKLSSPMILKFTQYSADSGTNKLSEELESFRKIESCINNFENFAIPACYMDVVNQKVAFLLSPFKSSTFPIQNHERHILQENNLWKLLIDDEYLTNNTSHIKSIKSKLRNTYLYLHSFHDHSDKIIKKSTYLTEYDWYLRGLEKQDTGWLSNLETTWEARHIKTVNNFGNDYWNPLYVYDKIKNLEHNFKFGAVHGDLHPRNVVIGFDDSANIIDFGWSTNEAHIIKDFVLMEANLRFASLHSKFTYKFVSTLAKVIKTKDIANNEDHGVYSLISLIRERCEDLYKINKQDIDWMKDYLIPLFLVSLGLAKFMNTHNNLISTHLTLLELSSHIAEDLKLK